MPSTVFFLTKTFRLTEDLFIKHAFRTRRTGESRTSLREHASCDRANHTRQYGASGTQREISPLENRIEPLPMPCKVSEGRTAQYASLAGAG